MCAKKMGEPEGFERCDKLRWSVQSSFRVKRWRMLLRSASEDPTMSRFMWWEKVACFLNWRILSLCLVNQMSDTFYF